MSAETSAEAAARRELSRLVRQLTESGLPELDAALLRRVKQLCRPSERLVDAAYDLALSALRRPHAERRLSAFQLLDQLFRRSHRLRERAVADLQTIIDLCFETAGPLPQPWAAARRLTSTAAAALRYWHDTYASGYKKLAVAYRFLQQNRPSDLPPSREEEDAARRAADAERDRLQRLKAAKLEQVQREIGERRDEIVNTVTQVENCFRLLMPDVALLDAVGGDGDAEGEGDDEGEEDGGGGTDSGGDADGVEEEKGSDVDREVKGEKEKGNDEGDGNLECNGDGDEEDSGEEEEDATDQHDDAEDWTETGILRGHGVTSRRQRVQVTVPSRPAPLDVTDDNAALVETLRGLVTAVRRSQLPTVQRWLQLAEMAGGAEDVLRQLSAVRDALSSALRRYDALQLRSRGEDSSSDDSDMEEVPDAEDAAALAARATRSAASAAAAASAATAAAAAVTTVSNSSESKPPVTEGAETDAQTKETDDERSARRARLLSLAPKLAYNPDLVTWERGPGPAAAPAPHACETARVWRSAADSAPPPAESADARVTEFTGEFEPVLHRCGTRLPSGRLCPRADRVRCPLHGDIVPRDEYGEPLSAELRQREREMRARGVDWQDPKLLAELRAATGLDLTVRRGRRRPLDAPGPGLTDLKRPATARRRLADKLFSGSTVRRVAAALDRLDRRRHGDKFGDQFNYQVTGGR